MTNCASGEGPVPESQVWHCGGGSSLTYFVPLEWMLWRACALRTYLPVRGRSRYFLLENYHFRLESIYFPLEVVGG